MAIATTYRPTRFADVVGQEGAVEALKAIAKADGVIVRSILLQGSWGSGKTTIARIFGKAVSCKNFKTLGDVCNECEGCLEASAQNSRSYIEYDATKVGSVESIRGMDAIFSAAVNGRRVIVFDEIHTASKAAQSALLKILEEGVKDTFIVFCTTGTVLETISSRSITIDITTIPAHLIETRVKNIAELRGYTLSADTLASIALKSKGHMRDALSILEHYELVGEVALRNPVNLIRQYFLKTFRKEPIDDLIKELFTFPFLEIRDAIYIVIKGMFTSTEGFETQIRQKGLHMKIFQFFFQPASQEALNDEFGVEILLRAFNERATGV